MESQCLALESYCIENGLHLIELYDGHYPRYGKCAGKLFNSYALVRENESDYYIAHANKDNEGYVIFKFAVETLDKFKELSEQCPTWYMMSNGYIATTVKSKTIYFHAHVMDYYGQRTPERGLDTGLSVDHINQDKLDNRVTNLRLANQHVQNVNSGRVYVRRTLPPAGFGCEIPKFIQYRPEAMHAGAKHGCHFIVEFRVPCTGQRVSKKTTKASDRSLYYKLIQAIKMRYMLVMDYPELYSQLEGSPDSVAFQTGFLEAQRQAIREIARLDIIPETDDLTRIDCYDFPHVPVIAPMVATQPVLAEAAVTVPVPAEAAVTVPVPAEAAVTVPVPAEPATDKVKCPDCDAFIVKKTLKRHQANFCPNRVLSEEQQADIARRKEEHYAKVSASKIANSSRKITDEDILLIRESARLGKTQQAIAEHFQLSRQYVRMIILGKTKLKSDVVDLRQQHD